MVSVWCVSEAIKVKISCGIACHHGLKACDVFGGVFITPIYANHIYVLHVVFTNRDYKCACSSIFMPKF